MSDENKPAEDQPPERPAASQPIPGDADASGQGMEAAPDEQTAHAADVSGASAAAGAVPSEGEAPTAQADSGAAPSLPDQERSVVEGEANPPPPAARPQGVEERFLPVSGLADADTQEEEPAGSGNWEPEDQAAAVHLRRGELAEEDEAPTTSSDEAPAKQFVEDEAAVAHRQTANPSDDDERDQAAAASTAEQAPLEPPPPTPPRAPRRKRSAEPIELIEETEESEIPPKEWYILKVATNRENSACDALRRRVKIAGLEEHFGDIIVPTEDIVEYKDGKRRTLKRKLFPGYIVIHMSITDDTWFLVRETPGVGDFTGAAGKPAPMLPHEIERVLPRRTERPAAQEKVAISFRRGDHVRVKEGNFQNYEGDVEGVDEANGRVTVVINIFNRSTPVEFDYWQIEAV